MKNIVFVLAFGFTLTLSFSSCKKEVSISEQPNQSEFIQSFNKSSEVVDPVIERFSSYGLVYLADDGYSKQVDKCSPPLGVYIFTPSFGPYSGKQCEIYRYAKYADVQGPCGDEFDRLWQPGESFGNVTIGCPKKGTNCQEIDAGELGCVFIHCDESN
ncbi:MAG: hypothetical protein SchgKO_19640 [Schleiferiaceae bacterium]